MTSPSSFNVSGLLTGAAASIDTTALITQLMQAQALPQTRLKNQLAVQQAIMSAYQAINTKVSAVQTAARALIDPSAWTGTTASSSTPGVLASSTGSAAPGTTSFDVVQLARAQLSTVAADASGNVVGTPSAGITVTSSDGTLHPITLTSGSAVDVAAAINSAQVGVRASVVNADSGPLLQLVSSTTGAAAGFTVTGFSAAPQTVVAAQDAKISVGDPLAGGYAVSSPTNTFSGMIPGVTFSISGIATNVSISVGPDTASISGKVQALVSAANAASTEIASDSSKGAILQGNLDAQTLSQSMLFAVSKGTAAGGSLKPYGIDIDKTGTMSFDAAAFAAAYAADPAGTRTAVAGSFAAALNTTATAATDPTTGAVTQAINSANAQSSTLNHQIDDWTSRLSDIQAGLQAKYTAMQSMLAKLQSQSTFLTSMLTSLNPSTSTTK
ncbi:MAG: Flagellar hook-associated protein 2 [Pseudonocardiales bacterium]|nr:Flagellar hook-associated protein 2 [Pseudonocardiales bacterium]